MFTGIVEEIGSLRAYEPTGIVIEAQHILEDLNIKDSISVDGICLTVTERGENWFRVDTMPETLRRTRLGSLQVGDPINLERSLLANGRMGGHMVQGHVEACVPILELSVDGIGLDVIFELPKQLKSYIVPKGFIALNGISLTVVDVWDDRFSISLIPYTREHTNFGQARVGSQINVETDIIGRYVAQFLKAGAVIKEDL
jgi:riboflavin synthase